MMRSKLVLLLLVGVQTIMAELYIHPGAQYSLDSYFEVASKIRVALSSSNSSVCVSHSRDGAENMAFGQDFSQCDAAILVGAAPAPELLQRFPAQLPVLVVQNVLDGIVRFSEFAVARHRSANRPLTQFVVIEGANHHSITSTGTPPSSLTKELDLKATMSQSEVHDNLTAIIVEFLSGGQTGTILKAASERAQVLSEPLTRALELEGSTALGHPSCNSDFPTNPTCQYPKYPDHSLPPGPAKAPSPPLPSDCVCGSPWVAKHAAPIITGFEMSKSPSFSVEAKDAYQDVSDVHPFHLPHLWNDCNEGSTSCTLNVTTLTLPVSKAGDLFPNKSAAPLSFYEFKTKLKSRVASWEAAGLGAQSGDLDTKNNTMCRAVNEEAYAWALSNAEESVRERFLKNGEPFVMVDDKEATIGYKGPEWIADEMVYKRVKTATGSRIEIQSWKFVVSNTNEGHVPWFLPAGMHYCKLLSPARAMEWIYTDGLRAKLALH